MESLNEFLATDMKAKLKELFDEIRFPFEDPVDYRVVRPQLESSIEILRALRGVYQKTDRDD